MNRAEFRKHVKPLVPSAQFSTGDALGTKLHRDYIDVTVPTSNLKRLIEVCRAAGYRAHGVSVLPYPVLGVPYSHRRINLTERLS